MCPDLFSIHLVTVTEITESKKSLIKITESKKKFGLKFHKLKKVWWKLPAEQILEPLEQRKPKLGRQDLQSHLWKIQNN